MFADDDEPPPSEPAMPPLVGAGGRRGQPPAAAAGDRVALREPATLLPRAEGGLAAYATAPRTRAPAGHVGSGLPLPNGHSLPPEAARRSASRLVPVAGSAGVAARRERREGLNKAIAGPAPQAVTSRMTPAQRDRASPNLVCRISYIRSVSPLRVPTPFGPITGFGVIYGGLVRCNLSIGIGLGAQLTTPRGRVKSEVGPKDTVARHLRVAGGYFENQRQSWRVLLVYGLAAAPNYRWIRRRAAGGCHGYGSNLLLCATHGRVFR